MATDVYGMRALDFVACVTNAKSRREIIDLILKEMEWYGFSFVTSWSQSHPELSSLESADINTRPNAYIDHYIEKNLLYKDPVIGAMRETLASLSWSDIRANFRLTKSERMILDEARDFGAFDGLTIPVLSTSGCVGVFCPCGKNPDLSPRARAALELVCLFAHQALQRSDICQARSDARHTPLTPREREIMRWVAIGKTNDEVGSILGIQGETVKTILSRAQRKLNAASRTYAVVQAIRLGELDLNF